jgi:uridine kinase
MGMTLAQLAAEKQNEYKDEIILANVNGKLKELGEEYIPDSDVTFVTTSTSIGNETYRRSVVLLMLAAIDKIDRNIDRVVVEYSLSKGLYCTFDGDFRPDKEFIDEVKSVMHSMVEKDLPIKKELMKISDAMNLFKEKGMTDKTSLFKYRRSSFVNVYDLNGYKDYFYGYMASSTGMLGVFDIFLYDEGIVLQLPVKNAPLEVPEFNPQTKLFNVLKESTSWAKMLGMSTVGELNDHITNGDMTSFMLTQEALQEQKIVSSCKNLFQ